MEHSCSAVRGPSEYSGDAFRYVSEAEAVELRQFQNEPTANVLHYCTETMDRNLSWFLNRADEGTVNKFVFRKLFEALRAVHEFTSTSMRLELRDSASKHPALNLIALEPFCSHAIRKPKGYNGDADLLDMLYGVVRPDVGHLSDLPRELNSYIFETVTTLGAQGRLATMAHQITQSSNHNPKPRIASVACGLLREVDLVDEPTLDAISELVVIDQDADALSRSNDRLGNKVNLTPIRTKIGSLMNGDFELPGSFDLIYVSGLYDYLTDAESVALTKALMTKLNRKGRLVLTNLSTACPEKGFAEFCLNWPMIYRTPEEMIALASDCCGHNSRFAIASDRTGTFLYLTIERSLS